MLNEIQEVGDPVTSAFYSAIYALYQWASSEYREASRKLSGAVSYLLDTSDDYLNLSLIVWIHQLFSPSSLLLLGEWGEAFRGFRAGIAMLERNMTNIARNTLRLYLAWAHLHAMDFEGALRICESSFPHPENFVLTMGGLFKRSSGGSANQLDRKRFGAIGFGGLRSGVGKFVDRSECDGSTNGHNRLVLADAAPIEPHGTLARKGRSEAGTN